MKFGVGIPTCRQGFDVPPGFAGPKEIVEVSQLAEKLGVDFVWGSDFASPIPAMRERLGAKNLNWYEIVVSMAYIAASTKRIGLGFGVIILPFRDPLMLAKEIATLDVFSNGRVMFGVGLGVFRPEFEMLYPLKAKANRGAMLDEGLQVLRLLFTETEATFEGEYFPMNSVAFHPKPVQNPFPIYVTGMAARTASRAARYGNGWVIDPNPVDVLREAVDKLKGAAEQEKRDISEFHIICCGGLSIAKTRDAAYERFVKSFVGARFAKDKTKEEVLATHFIGTPQEIAKRIKEREKGGATHLVTQSIAGDTFQEMKEQVQMFAEEVIPLCK